MIDIGKRVQQLRKANKQTQQDLADLLSVQSRTLAGWERGERDFPLDIIVKLADLYKVSTDYLFCRTDDPFIVHRNDDNSVDLVIDVPVKEEQKPVETVTMKMPGTPEELAAFVKQIMQTATVGGNGKE